MASSTSPNTSPSYTARLSPSTRLSIGDAPPLRPRGGSLQSASASGSQRRSSSRAPPSSLGLRIDTLNVRRVDGEEGEEVRCFTCPASLGPQRS
ncbi:hypothetical protein BCR33DRAFT_720069 [Rhizoclosmatium globosum]|uniref:Uncharacterized protein n=1 Tax=Rhizoclosmatium globosum TaxID=329046 RepID=A0A1Y2BXX2_9FUNG|nr:hypothetical protein BCR33DRAFT_720069 [Rhizoclosmatium globosum]|eukprot:ORY39619.1 hypothetical protein BCR33DRAFT_720069 [Rhizoclosmatium globosum]